MTLAREVGLRARKGDPWGFAGSGGDRAHTGVLSGWVRAWSTRMRWGNTHACLLHGLPPGPGHLPSGQRVSRLLQSSGKLFLFFKLKWKGTQMSPTPWNVAAAVQWVALSPSTAFLGERPRRCGLKWNKNSPPHLQSAGIVASSIFFQL